MTRIQRSFLLFLAGLAGLWWLADPNLPQPLTYFSFRAWFLQASGVLAIGCMSAILVLAVRPRWLEPHLQGLDKMYRLHKWLGITALVTAVLHWWLAQGTKWMVGWGWLVRPPRPPRPAVDERGLIEAFLGSQRGLAESVGEWAFYAAALLMVLALVKRLPYRWFSKTHTLLAAGYLALVYHSVVLLKFAYWGQPVGWLLALLLAAGAVSAVRVLSRQVGARRQVAGQVSGLHHYAGVDSLVVQLQLAEGWPGHRAGQFAFVTLDPAEGPHPYTMASAWDPAQRELRFIIKALGDHTRGLAQHLQVGQPVQVEGPYGCFDFEDGRTRQIWVGAGIGITPFVARLQQLARLPQAERQRLQIDLIHPTAQEDPAALARLRSDAEAAGVRLHVLVDARDGRLDGARLERLVQPDPASSLWFCGPAGFGQALKRSWVGAGHSPAHFHQELFEMR